MVFRPRSVLSVYSETSASPSSAPCLPSLRHSCSSFFPPSFQPCFIYPHLHLSFSLSLSFFSLRLFSSNGPPTSLVPPFTKLIKNRGYGHRGAGVSKVLGYGTIGGAELLERQTLLGPRLSFPSSPVSKRSRRWYRVYTEIFIEERNDSLARVFRDGLGSKKRKKEKSFESIAIARLQLFV